MQKQPHRWQRPLVISEGYWLTAGRYQSWQDGGAQRIWMKQQQNGFASPSLSIPLRRAEWEWLRKKKASAYSGRRCIIYTEEHKQSWTNCLKHKMWFFCIQPSICLHRHSFSPAIKRRRRRRKEKKLPSLFISYCLGQTDFTFSYIFKQWAHFTQFQAGRVKIRGASVKWLMPKNSRLYIHWFWDVRK